MSKTIRQPMGAHEKFPDASRLLDCLLRSKRCDICEIKNCKGRAIYEKNKRKGIEEAEG